VHVRDGFTLIHGATTKIQSSIIPFTFSDIFLFPTIAQQVSGKFRIVVLQRFTADGVKDRVLQFIVTNDYSIKVIEKSIRVDGMIVTLES
jgi:hypothetical protein